MKLPGLFKTQKFYSLSASLFNAAVALVSFWLLVRTLTKLDFGNWAFFLAVYGIYEMALNGFIKTPVIKFASDKVNYDYGEVIASAWDLVIKITIGAAIIIGLGFALVGLLSEVDLYFKFAYWMPLFMIAAAPNIMGVWVSNAMMRFERIFLIRATLSVMFFTLVLIGYKLGADISWIFWSYLAANVCASLLALVSGWSSVSFFFTKAKTYQKEIVAFGKYSMGTTLSTSILVSSDSFIIVYFLGPEALAVFEVPKRISALYEIPLRSILTFAYPKLAKDSSKIESREFKQTFRRLVGFTLILLMPAALSIFIFAEPLVILLGGEAYADSAMILRMFALFLFFAPLDRFSGLILDIMNRPDINFSKVLLMLLVNIIGDILALHFGFGLVGVAAITTFTVATGIIYGFYRHRKVISFDPFEFLKQGLVQMRLMLREIGL